MGKNAYFQLIEEEEKMYLKVYEPEGDGEMFQVADVTRYLDAISFPEYDVTKITTYLDRGVFGEPFLLWSEPIIPVGGKCIVSVDPDGMKATARFYPPSTGGEEMTENEIIGDLRIAGVKYGVKRKAIDHFLQNREYCRDYLIAVATKPRQGHDVKVTYHFDINQTVRPKMNEDGSVDFHQLGNIKPVEAGQKLATLTPVDFGNPGMSVTGKPLKPKVVRNKALRFGRNIRISEDRCKIYSEVSGHVTLVEDMVMVSDIYQVPANVDSSTGDIEYNGTVQVTGNVNTGYKIKADVLRLYFAPSYSELSKGREVLTRAAIVRSFCQLDGISQVEFYVGDMPLIGFNGVVTGAMSADQFIDNAGNEINAYEQTTISLYLTDETGSTLREIHRDCVYNSNISIDKLVVEEIIRGPENGEEKYLYPVISPMTKVISVTTADGTCYVNLDSGFLEKQGNVTPEVAIYSIVNSLVEQPNINKVQISVDGNSDIMFMETIPLTQVFERNLEIMNTQ